MELYRKEPYKSKRVPASASLCASQPPRSNCGWIVLLGRLNLTPRARPDPFISVIGGDTQIAAVNAAISLGERFEIEGPGVERISVCLGRNPQTNKGALQLADRKKPLRHLVAMSEEFSNPSAATGRTLLADSRPVFVWPSLAHIHGLPGVPEWAEWFYRHPESHKALITLLGIGCQPVLIKGNKQQFLSWLGRGVLSGELEFPSKTGPIQWGTSTLAEIFSLGCASAHTQSS